MINNVSLIRTIIDVAITLMLYKGIFEPLAAYYGNRLAIQYIPKLLDKLDQFVPNLLKEGREKFKNIILEQIEILSKERGESLTKSQKEWLVKQYEKSYSPIVNASKLQS